MKYVISSLILFFCVKSTFLYTQVLSPSVKKIATDVYFYFGDEKQQKPSNCLWIVMDKYVVVIDANYPWGAQDIITEIKKTTQKPIRYIINTHYHHDHSFGNSVFVDAGAEIISSQTTAYEMRTVGQIEWNRGTAYSGRDMKKYRREFPTITFENQMILQDEYHKIILHKIGPGHTAGDIFIHLPNEKIIATGDLCVNGNPWGNNVADVNADFNGWLQALDTMINSKAEIVIPGHGDPGTTEILIQQKEYLSDMLMQVTAAIHKGMTRDECLKFVNLSHHPIRGANTVSSERSIKAMYDRLVGKK